MRRPIVVGNWKMNTRAQSAVPLAEGVVAACAGITEVTVAVCPPLCYLAAVSDVIENTDVGLGAQNLYLGDEGAFTGEVSGPMLVDVGCTYVIVGHSERRHVLGETDDIVHRKLQAALAAGLTPILCIGELLEERRADETSAVIERQVRRALEGLTAEQVGQMVIAYEPVWAIGTGEVATPAQAQEVHALVRSVLSELYDAALADGLPIQYGGSVKPDNADGLLSQPDIDGALVGGASLKADAFAGIVKAARPR